MIFRESLLINGSKDKKILLDIFFKKNNSKKNVVLFSHGFKGFKDWGPFNQMAEFFANNNFFFIKFNFSYNGTSIDNPVEFVDLNAFGNNNLLKKWAIDTNYLDYISISFHWDSTLILPKVYGFPSSDWGVGFVVMSDYMKFKESNSATVISVMATILDKKSAKLNKTANECYDKQEVIDEIFRQLNESFSGALEPPTVAIMTPNIFYDMKKKKWDSYDTAYIAAINTNPIPFYSTKYDKLYTLGTHNGKSVYKFTSMESAVTNAIALSHEIYPILKYKYPIKVAPNVTKILIYTIIAIIIIFIIVKFVRF